MKQHGVAHVPPPTTNGKPPPAPERPRLAAARERAARTATWAREHVPYADLVVDALERERLAAAGLLAGGVAYRLFFWTVPMGLVLAAIASFWVRADRAGLEDAAREFGLAGASASAAADAIQSGAHSRWYFLVVGLGLVLWFGTGVVRALYVAHAVAWRLRPEKLARPLRASVAFTAILVVLVGITAAAAPLREATPGPGLGYTLALVAVYCAIMAWATRLLPSRASGWASFLPGAILFGVGTQLVHLAVVLYLAPKLGRSSELYGTLGAATTILLWLYLEARLVVGAAFLNAALWERTHPDTAAPSSP